MKPSAVLLLLLVLAPAVRAGAFPDDRAAEVASRRRVAAEAVPTAAPAPDFDVAAVMRDAVAVLPAPEGLVAAGGAYTARFGAGRVAIHPPGASGAAPLLALELAGIGRGPGVAFDARPAPARGPFRRATDAGGRARVERHVAPGVLEVWTPRAAGVELAYRFDAPPAGGGDLVVRLVADTPLAAPRVAAADGLDLAHPDLGAVRVGGVTGIDAAGRRTAGTLRWDGEHLDLALPADFVDAASYPLLLDPLIGVLRPVPNASTLDYSPDVAWADVAGRWAVVWNRDTIFWGHAALMQVLEADGTPAGGVIVLGTEGVDTRPAVAYLRSSDRFVFVRRSCQGFGPCGAIPGGGRAIVGSVHAGSRAFDRAQSRVFGLQMPEDLDVGADPVPGYHGVLVVVATVRGRVWADFAEVRPDGEVVSHGFEWLLHEDSREEGLRASVSKSAGAAGRWYLAWSSAWDGATPRARIRHAVVWYDGQLALADADAVVVPGRQPVEPAATGDGDHFALSWVQRGGAVEELWTDRYRMEWLAIDRLRRRRVHAAGAGERLEAPDVEWCGQGAYALAWNELGASTALRALSLTASDLEACESIAKLATGTSFGRPRLYSPASASVAADPGWAAIVTRGRVAGSLAIRMGLLGTTCH